LPKPFGFEEILAKELLQLGAQDGAGSKNGEF
jgi:hypothetical protein